MKAGQLAPMALQELKDLSLMADQTLTAVAKKHGFEKQLRMVMTVENALRHRLLAIQLLSGNWLRLAQTGGLSDKEVAVERLVCLCDETYAQILSLAEQHGFEGKIGQEEAVEHELYALLLLMQYTASSLLRPALRKPLAERLQGAQSDYLAVTQANPA